MGKVARAAVLGFFSPFVFIAAGSAFEVVGKTSFKEILAGSIAEALFLTVCQFLLARNERRNSRPVWPITAGMAASLLVWFVFIAIVESRGAAIPILLSGVIGIVVGAVIAVLASTKRSGQVLVAPAAKTR